MQPTEQPFGPLVKEFLSQRAMRILHLPGTDELLDAAGTEHYAYNKTFEEAAYDPFCVLHTSGSTGLPKPIAWTHALIGTMDAVRLLPPVEGDQGLAPWTNDWKKGDRIYSSFPMSHVRSNSFSYPLKTLSLIKISLLGRRNHYGHIDAIAF